MGEVVEEGQFQDRALFVGEAGKLLGDDAVPPRKLMELVNAGHLGKKTGQGFYDWTTEDARRAQSS